MDYNFGIGEFIHYKRDIVQQIDTLPRKQQPQIKFNHKNKKKNVGKQPLCNQELHYHPHKNDAFYNKWTERETIIQVFMNMPKMNANAYYGPIITTLNNSMSNNNQNS